MTIKAILTLRVQAKKLSESHLDQINFARSFVGGVLVTMFPSSKSPPVPVIQHPLADEICQHLSKIELNMASYLLGSIYTVMLPKEFRSAYGVFYTPPSLTERLLDMAEKAGINWGTARVIDPACGGGAFLAPVARRMVKTLDGLSPEKIVDSIKQRLYGLEIDSFSAWMTEVFVEAALRKELNDLPELNSKGFVRVCNSLKETEDLYSNFDLVIGNPPYGRIKLNTEDREKWERGLYGHANLYGLFIDLALRLINKKGSVAYITPTSFLGGQYFKSLRRLILHEAPPIEINFIAKREGVFADVLQETLLAVYQRTSLYDHTSVAFLDVKEDGIVDVTHGGEYQLYRGCDNPWYLPRNKSQKEAVSFIEAACYRLADIGFEVSTGPLVWNRHKDRLLENKRQGAVPLIWAEAIDPDGSGTFTFKTSGKNHVPWYIPYSDKDPNIITKSCVLLQRTSSIEQQRRLAAAVIPQEFIDDNGGAVCIENHINMIKPMTGVIPKISAMTLAIFLNTRTADQIFRCINGSTAVSAYELENMPIPSLNSFVALEELLIGDELPSIETIENTVKEMYSNVCSRTAA